MKIDPKLLVQEALDLGAANAAMIEVVDIPVNRDFRQACESNRCGNFGRNWTCPPEIGDIDTLMAELKTFQTGIIYQTVTPIADSFDIEGMLAAGEIHNRLTMKLRVAYSKYSFAKALHLGAGGCRVCERCAKRKNEPCRFPDQAIASLEAYGVSVYELANKCGMKYINGKNTVTYFGGFLYSE